MSKVQQQVAEFHEVFDLERSKYPKLPENYELRTALIGEELYELEQAFKKRDLVAVADGIGDLLYVVYGTAVACGISMDEVMDEIHASNMTKVGGFKREDGKWMKPPTYKKPNLAPILERQFNEYTQYCG